MKISDMPSRKVEQLFCLAALQVLEIEKQAKFFGAVCKMASDPEILKKLEFFDQEARKS